jgi:cation diffusion facilitator CzcD-associated flavoprotein CzcO
LSESRSLRALRIAIIGAGPAGLAAGHELLAQGFRDFTIYEATDAVGGTWHIHTYPGLACDVWAHSYTFSYRPNPDWSASFVEQPEIEAYLQTCATEFGLDPHIRLDTRIAKIHYQGEGHWRLESEAGESFEADVVINAMGNQHTPLYPDVPGMEDFRGESFHATRWNHDVELAGKRIAVVGSAASAVQIVPEVAKVAGHLTVLQRSANWIMPRGRKPYSASRRAWFRRWPALIRLTQRFQLFLMGFVQPAVTLGNPRMKDFEKRVKKFLKRTVPDEELRRILTPDTHYGCKRGLVSDDFYPTLMRDNVELVPEALARVRPEGLTTSSGRQIDVDVILYCTGYRILDFDRIEVLGEDGRSLAKQMEEAPEAHKGIAAPGFPNYFFAVGPNGLVLNVPYFKTVEQNVRTIVARLVAMQAAGACAIAVKPVAHRVYNDWLATQFPLYSWGHASCQSYYRTASGRAPFLFPGDFETFARLQDEGGLHEYELEPGFSPRAYAPSSTARIAAPT